MVPLLKQFEKILVVHKTVRHHRKNDPVPSFVVSLQRASKQSAVVFVPNARGTIQETKVSDYSKYNEKNEAQVDTAQYCRKHNAMYKHIKGTRHNMSRES